MHRQKHQTWDNQPNIRRKDMKTSSLNHLPAVRCNYHQPSTLKWLTQALYITRFAYYTGHSTGGTNCATHTDKGATKYNKTGET